MRIAIPTRDYRELAGHAGRARHWLVFDCEVGHGLPEPRRVELEPEQILHLADESGPHPLDGVDLVIAGSAGDGFVRHMARRGAEVVLTGEPDPQRALAAVIAGDALPDPRRDLSQVLCRVRDFFSRY